MAPLTTPFQYYTQVLANPPGSNSKKFSFHCLCIFLFSPIFLSFFNFLNFFISWRLITLQYCSGFCHTLTWISHGFPCIPHPDTPSHLPLYSIPLGLPSAPGPSACLMHPTWAGDLFHPAICIYEWIYSAMDFSLQYNALDLRGCIIFGFSHV